MASGKLPYKQTIKRLPTKDTQDAFDSIVFPSAIWSLSADNLARTDARWTEMK